MCQKYYRKCGKCGSDIHMNFYCVDCLKEIDPWDVLQSKHNEIHILRNKLTQIEEVLNYSKGKKP